MTARKALNAEDRALLASLLHEMGPRLFGYVRKLSGRAADAEDIVAEAFVRAADNIDTLRNCARKDLYLLTTARNLCRDAFRKKRPQIVSQEQLADRPGDLAASADSAAQTEDRQRLLAAVSELPEGQREVVVLRMTAELKFEEIAEVLGIPLGTALSRMSAALRDLRRAMGTSHVHE